jgi:hypothetical protein
MKNQYSKVFKEKSVIYLNAFTGVLKWGLKRNENE